LRSWQRMYDLARAEYEAQIRLLELELKDAESAFTSAAGHLTRLGAAGPAVSDSESKLAEGQRALDAARARVERAKTLLDLYRKVDPGDSPQPYAAAQPTVTPGTNGTTELQDR